jgi:hypothetical protein
VVFGESFVVGWFGGSRSNDNSAVDKPEKAIFTLVAESD